MLKRMPWPVILQIVPELSAGGAERTAIEMAEAITLAGGRALVLSAGGRLEDELAEAGGELIRFPAKTKNPIAILFNALRLVWLIRGRGVSLVHARSRAPAWSALLAARRTRRCFVTTYHGIYNQKSRLKALYNSVMARGDAVICNSRYTANLVCERHPEAAARVGVIYRGVDLKSFDPAAVSAERVRELREQWGVPAGKRIVLLPARLTRWKGQTVLIDAAAQLFARGDYGDVVFVLAGDEQGRSSFKAELEASIEQHGLARPGVRSGPLRRYAGGVQGGHLHGAALHRGGGFRPFGHRIASHGLPGYRVQHRGVSGDRDTRAGASRPCRQRPGKRGRGQSGLRIEPRTMAFRAGQRRGPLQFAALRPGNGRLRAGCAAAARH